MRRRRVVAAVRGAAVVVRDDCDIRAEVYVSVPEDEIAGCTLKRALLSLVTVKVTVCVCSSAVGPGLMLEA